MNKNTNKKFDLLKFSKIIAVGTGLDHSIVKKLVYTRLSRDRLLDFLLLCVVLKQTFRKNLIIIISRIKLVRFGRRDSKTPIEFTPN